MIIEHAVGCYHRSASVLVGDNTNLRKILQDRCQPNSNPFGNTIRISKNSGCMLCAWYNYQFHCFTFLSHGLCYFCQVAFIVRNDKKPRYSAGIHPINGFITKGSGDNST